MPRLKRCPYGGCSIILVDLNADKVAHNIHVPCSTPERKWLVHDRVHRGGL